MLAEIKGEGMLIERAGENESAEITSLPPDRIIELLRRRAATDSAAPAIIAENAAALSYGELLDQIERTARVLTATGVRPEDRVVVVGSSSAEMVVLFLSVAAVAGCAPLNPSYTLSEFDFYLRDLTPRLLIVEAVLPCPVRDVARKLDIPVLEFRTDSQSGITISFSGAVCEAACAKFATAADTALVLHTSGTTARPKMVPLTQRNLCCSALNIVRSLDLSPTDRCLSVMPLFHVHGLIGAALSTFASGGCLVCAGVFRPSKFFGWVDTFQPSWYTAVPSMHTAVLAQAGEISSSNRLRFIRSCSAPLPSRIATGLEDLFGVPVVEAYGMTEAAHQIACNPLPSGRRKIGSVGVPTGTEIAIVDDTGAQLPPGAEGEIIVRGLNVMEGYIAGEDVNAAAFIEGWFRTGDQGRLDKDGYLFITGRIKEIINRAGEKISPREIDDVLLAHPAVAEALTFSIPDERLGEEVGAAIVLRPDGEGVDARSLLSFAQTRLAPFKLPRRILFVSEIPKGPTGKPQRIGLADRLRSAEESVSLEVPDSAVTFSSPTELTLLGLCRDIFQVATIDTHKNLFKSGADADSLSAEILLIEIERHWNVSVTIADLLAGPTIAELAKLIDAAGPGREAAQLWEIQAGGTGPPFFCIGAGPRFRELARLLGSERPFLATVHPRQPGWIEDLAIHHLQIIRDAQPHGPYALGGYCVDGLVAYEIAQRLWALGEPVELLVLFDTSFCSSRFDAVCHVVEAEIEHYRSRGLDWSGIRRRFLRRSGSGAERIQGPIDRNRREEFRRGRGWMEERVRNRAIRTYRPRRYDGHVLFLHSQRMQARQDWRRYVRGEFEAYQIPGNHWAMFEKPHVAITAERLRVALRKASSG